MYIYQQFLNRTMNMYMLIAGPARDILNKVERYQQSETGDDYYWNQVVIEQKNT